MSAIEKISHVDSSFLATLPFTYFSCAPFIDFAAYRLLRNDESILVVEDAIYPHEFPALVLPQQQENWEQCSLLFCTDEWKSKIQEAGIELIVDRPLGSEFYYATAAFVEPAGSLRKKANVFQKKYTFTMLHAYPTQKIREFYQKWKSQRPRAGGVFDEGEKFFDFCLDHLDVYGIRQVYVEIAGELAGFGWGVPFLDRGWVGLHLKVDYTIKGLSRFIHIERAKLFSEFAEFTLGTSAQEAGIEDYKRELGPVREVPYWYVLTGGKVEGS